METKPPEPAPPGGASSPRAEAAGGSGATASGPSPTDPGRRLWAPALLAGLLAGLLGWGAGEAALIGFKPYFFMDAELVRSIETSTAEVRRQQEEATTRSAAASYGALAGLLGLALGVAGGIAGRSGPRAIQAAALGAVLGGLAGAGSSYALAQVFHELFRPAPEQYAKDLMKPLLLHGGMWLPAGLFGGLALGFGFGGGARAAQAAFGGVLGVVAAVLLYEMVAALAFPGAKTTHPLATEPLPRLLAHLSVGLLVAVVACWSLRNMQLTRAKPRATT